MLHTKTRRGMRKGVDYFGSVEYYKRVGGEYITNRTADPELIKSHAAAMCETWGHDAAAVQMNGETTIIDKTFNYIY